MFPVPVSEPVFGFIVIFSFGFMFTGWGFGIYLLVQAIIRLRKRMPLGLWAILWGIGVLVQAATSLWMYADDNLPNSGLPKGPLLLQAATIFGGPACWVSSFVFLRLLQLSEKKKGQKIIVLMKGEGTWPPPPKR